MKSIWKVNYQNNEIEVVNTWFNGEKLYVNKQLQDEKLSFFSSDLTGHLFNLEGQREEIKVNLGGWFTVGCRLFINNIKQKTQQIK